MLEDSFFVRSALNDDEVKVLEKQKDEKGFDEKPAVVYLQVENVSTGQINIRKRMKNTNTVLEFIESAREEDDLTFEKFAYTYGTELDDVNGVVASEGYRWSVFKVVENDTIETEITFEIGSENLTDETTYIIRLTKTEQ